MDSPRSPNAAPRAGAERPKQNLLPVNAEILRTAQKAPGSEKIVVHAVVADRLTLVGTVKAKTETSTCIEYELSDATGDVSVKDYRDKRTGKAVQVDDVVRVVGQARVHSGPASMSVTYMAPVESSDEVEFHETEVKYVAYKLKPDNAVTRLAFASPEKEVKAEKRLASENDEPNAKKRLASENDEPNAKAPKTASLRDRVVEYLKTAPTDAGYKVAEVQKHLSGENPASVSSMLQTLVDEADAFTTVDLQTYALL
eukprot:CAMPEP_0204277838 /NCGR_PEP_ID=MMETSP0468-20130131/29534_1 /ASSEMBLY_ACC=CAM_ASM_000383 /TAXON_ID=2969 /ORGANISM="Oxyrrhis marina" /LENGTH=255 /DNA_ID=CAMNT_0051254677 /DNA_START=50 /DNA_END=817 /DNA_ORIENTATION=+